MSIDPTVTAEQSSAPRVAAVISGSNPDLVSRCLDALGGQVYEVADTVVVGGGDDVRHVAGDFEAMWRPTLRAAIESIGPEYTFVWALREGAVPDPQALRVLVQDAMRSDASVAGSKIVDIADRELLVSVGYATDVFGAPYSGLQSGELDQAQYDVIRDVAAVSGVSVLIRRDLYLGLGGIDRAMAPTAAAIDFCQRARLRGARVVTIPGSVVAFDDVDPSARWRERAGEIRAMIKSYSPVTLLWTLPLALLVGLAESVGRVPFGRFPLPGVIGAWMWNVMHLPSALRHRLQVRRGREAGDEELFRYQVSGSARLRALWDDLLVRIRERFPEGVLSGFADAVEAGQQRVRHPAFFVAALAALFAFVATREVWTEHLPISGFALPPPESAIDTLGAYAGGWNPAGLGSPEALRPSIGAVALVQLLVLGRSGLAIGLLTLGSFLGGVFATARLLRVWGIESISGYLAGATLMAGPAIVAATGASHWVAVPAFAAVPFAVWAIVRLPRRSGRERWGASALAALAVGTVGAFVPSGIIVPLLAVLALALVGHPAPGRLMGRAAVATLLAIPLLMPWVLYLDPSGFLESGPAAYWEPGWVAVGLVGLAAAGAILAGERATSMVAGWGAVLGGVGAIVARSGDFGFGTETQLGGLLMAGLGVAVVVGAGLEVFRRRRAVAGLRSIGRLAAGVAAFALVVATVGLAGPGRAGLPHDAFTGRFDFAIGDDGSATRVLLLGPVDDLPGSARTIDGLGYRVFVPPHPDSWEAHLAEERLGDEALAAVLQDLADGRTRRGGASLAEFGVGWIAFTEPSPLESVFETQLDLVALRSLDFPVFRNEAAAAIASTGDGDEWISDGTGFTAPAGGSSGPVFVASNADFRWGPGEWSQADWGNSIATQGDEIRFAPYAPRRLAAIGALVWLLALAGVAATMRRRAPE